VRADHLKAGVSHDLFDDAAAQGDVGLVVVKW
jgi:hypothetical protein